LFRKGVSALVDGREWNPYPSQCSGKTSAVSRRSTANSPIFSPLSWHVLHDRERPAEWFTFRRDIRPANRDLLHTHTRIMVPLRFNARARSCLSYIIIIRTRTTCVSMRSRGTGAQRQIIIILTGNQRSGSSNHCENDRIT